MAQSKPRRTVLATVSGHEVYNGKPTTQLEIPEWGSDYPTVIYGTTPEQQALLPTGQTLSVILEMDRIRDGKDPSKPYNYFWSFVGLADPTAEHGPPPPAQPRQAAPLPARSPVAAREDGIHRSVALQQAVAHCGHAVSPQEIVDTAQIFYLWLVGGGQTEPEVEE